ncbi:hypothetical protein ABZY06_18820, partial [Streptomyces sp. NPDC006540]|uniref:hypothetical protein n=1 Tax=Streptomyces sp. NPDC006540 TaxID=3155353 RepID=UPI0033BB7959
MRQGAAWGRLRGAERDGYWRRPGARACGPLRALSDPGRASVRPAAGRTATLPGRTSEGEKSAGPAARPGPEAVDRMLAEVVEGRPPER